MHHKNFGNFYTREVHAIPIPIGFIPIPIPIPIMSRMAIPIPMGFPWERDSHGVSHSHAHLYITAILSSLCVFSSVTRMSATKLTFANPAST